MYDVLFTIAGFSVIFIATTLGAALVFFFKRDISQKLNALFLGLAGGIMIAAAVWSLLIPSIESSNYLNEFNFLPALVGVLSGGVFLAVLDKILPAAAFCDSGELSKPLKTFIAITIHNIPEGLAVGLAYGGASVIGSYGAYISVFGFAVGIAIQNFPEGSAVSLPLKKVTGSSFKAFLFGMLSGAVEPVFALAGFFLSSVFSFIQPWFLAFAGGAMLFVVADNIIPDAKVGESYRICAWGVLIGFALMMTLDVVF